jgi:RecA/RadA recombinase
MPPKKKQEEPKPEENLPMSFEDLSSAISSSGGFSQTSYTPFERIKTGILSLDYCLGGTPEKGGGLPLGLVTHIAGPTGSGKTSLSVIIGVSARKAGMRVAVVNQEFRWNPSLAYKSGMGIPGKDYLLFSFANGEEVLNTITKLAKSGIDLVILDSVAATPSGAEANSEKIGEGSAYGAMAKMWSEWFRVHVSTISNANMSLLLLNQFRTDPNNTYAPIVRPGGKALEFYPAIAIDMQRIPKSGRIMVVAENQGIAKITSSEKKDDDALVAGGVVIEGKSWKNITAPNFREFSARIHFLNGGVFFDWPHELATWARAVGVFRNKDGNFLGSNGHWYLDGIKIAEKLEGVMEWLEDPSNAHQVVKIRQMVTEAAMSDG